MKRLLFLLLIVSSLQAFSQGTQGSTQYIGGPNTIVHNRGHLRTDSTLYFPSDTVMRSTWNRTLPALARKGNELYMWSPTSLRWLPVNNDSLRQSWSIVDSSQSDNTRNDAASAVRVNANTFFIAYTHYGSSGGDGSSTQIYGIFTDKYGTPTGSPFAITTDTFRYSVPSIYYNADSSKYVILCYTTNSVASVHYLRAMESTNLTTWTSPVTIFTHLRRVVSASDRVIRLDDGRWAYIASERANNGSTSVTGRNKGILFINPTGGINDWDSVATYMDADSSMAEAGIVQGSDSTKLYVYYRHSREQQQTYITIDNLTTFAQGAEKPSGIISPNSQHTIIYDPQNDIFIAAVNRVHKALSTLSGGDYRDRVYIDLWVSPRVFGDWELAKQLDGQRDKWYLEPTMKIDGDDLFATYSQYETADGEINLLARRIPIVSILPEGTSKYAKNINIRDYQDSTWQYGSVETRTVTMLHAGMRQMPRDSAYFEIRNQTGDAAWNTFRPGIWASSYKTYEGFTFEINKWSTETVEPFIHHNFKINQSTSGFAANQELERWTIGDQDVAGTIIKKRFADGREDFYERIKLVNKTAAQASSFTQLSAGQVYYNTDSSALFVYNGSAWRRLVNSTEVASGSSYLPLSGGTMTGTVTFSSGSVTLNIGNRLNLAGSTVSSIVQSSTNQMVIHSNNGAGSVMFNASQMQIGNGSQAINYINFRNTNNTDGYILYDATLIDFWANNVSRLKLGGATYTGAEITGNSKVTGTFWITGTTSITLASVPNYADKAAAVAGGVTTNQLWRIGNALQIMD